MRGRGRIRRISGALVWALVVAAVCCWAVYLRPESLGGAAAYVVVHGDSMLPTHRNGDLVVLRAQSVYRVGEVAAYRVPQGDIGAGAIVIHRIIGGSAASGFIMKGDNNRAPDPWRPKPANMVGDEVLRVPDAGALLARLRTPAVMGALAASVAAVAVMMRKRPARRTAVVASAAAGDA